MSTAARRTASTKAANKAPAPENKIDLDHPFTTAAGQRIESVTARMLTVKDMRETSSEVGEDQVAFELAMTARMLGMVPEDLDGMSTRDFMAVKRRFLYEMGQG